MSALARIVLLLGVTALIVTRLPNILLLGRFWAEEGEKFLVLAWSLPWWRALLSPWGGYLNVTANLAALMAWHTVSLDYAPYVTSLFALGFQLCPAILLLTSRLDWLNRPYVMVAALLMLLLVPVSEEIWLSSIGTQVHLSLCAGLILALETTGGGVGVFRLVLLALAALSGPGPWLLAPLFAARGALERSRARLLQAGVVSAGVLIQLVFFYSHPPGRAYAVHPLLFMAMAFDKHLLLPFLGPEWARPFAGRMYQAAYQGRLMTGPVIATALAGCVALAALVRHWRGEAFWLLGAACVLMAVSYVGALGDFNHMFPVGLGGRYVYAPQVLISLALLACAVTREGAVGVVATIAAAWLLTVGAIYYYLPSSRIFAEGPGWRTELALHRRDPTHTIASWPPGWLVWLPDDRPAVR